MRFSETYRYIVRSPGVRSGNPIVESTRIAVHDIIGLLQNGETIDTVKANCARPRRHRSGRRRQLGVKFLWIMTSPKTSAICWSNSATMSRYCEKPFREIPPTRQFCGLPMTRVVYS